MMQHRSSEEIKSVALLVAWLNKLVGQSARQSVRPYVNQSAGWLIIWSISQLVSQ